VIKNIDNLGIFPALEIGPFTEVFNFMSGPKLFGTMLTNSIFQIFYDQCVSDRKLRVVQRSLVSMFKNCH